MGRILAAAAFAALAFMLVGCIQIGSQKACEGYSGNQLSSCIYSQAVLDQNGFECYSLLNMTQRKMCIKDASDSSMKPKFQSMSENERLSIFSDESAKPAPSVPEIEQTDTDNETTVVINTGDNEDINESLYLYSDQYNAAVKSNNLQACEEIPNANVSKSCISQVARQTKNVTACGTLNSSALAQICRSYSATEQ
jgi:hypothetical protein